MVQRRTQATARYQHRPHTTRPVSVVTSIPSSLNYRQTGHDPFELITAVITAQQLPQNLHPVPNTFGTLATKTQPKVNRLIRFRQKDLSRGNCHPVIECSEIQITARTSAMHCQPYTKSPVWLNPTTPPPPPLSPCPPTLLPPLPIHR